MYFNKSGQTTPTASIDRRTFARQMTTDAFAGDTPHPSSDAFVDRTPAELAALRRGRRGTPADALKDLAHRWAEAAS